MSDPATSSSHRLVFGDDGSPDADVAWLWINNHPWPGWRLDVLTGAEPPFEPGTWGKSSVPEPWTPPWGRRYIGEAPPERVQHLYADTDPRLLLSEQTDAQLIVVGHTGASGLRATWLGSTTEWLLQHPVAPLLIARSAALVRTVVCCVDGSVHATRALETFLSLPLAASTSVHVLAVDDGRVDVDAATKTAAEHVSRAGLVSQVDVVEGRPTRVITDYVATHGPELVVLGTKGLTGWRRLRFGSTAGAVVHHTGRTCLLGCADEGESGPGDGG